MAPGLAPEGQEWFLLPREGKQRGGRAASWHIPDGSWSSGDAAAGRDTQDQLQDGLG